MELRIGVVIMQRDLRTLLCVTALIGAMSSGLVYADGLTVTGTESHTGTYDSINVESAGSLTVSSDTLTSSGAFTNSGTVTNNYSIVTQTIQNNTTIEGTGNLTVNGVGLTTGTSLGANSNSIRQGYITLGSAGSAGLTFTNTGSITGAITNYTTIDGAGTANISGGSNAGAISQAVVNITGDYSNTGSITANSSFSNNSGVTFTNDDSLDVTGTFTNSGTIQESVSGTNNSSLSINATNPFRNHYSRYGFNIRRTIYK